MTSNVLVKTDLPTFDELGQVPEEAMSVETKESEEVPHAQWVQTLTPMLSQVIDGDDRKQVQFSNLQPLQSYI